MANTLAVGSDPLALLRTQPATIKAWIQLQDLNGQVLADRVPITHLTLRFPLIGIATADFILAVGYDVKTGVLAAINQTQGLENQVRVSCYVKVSGANPDFSGDTSRRWDDAGTGGQFRIWDGLVVSPGYTVSRENNSYTLHSQHWIAELDSATLTSGSFISNAAENLLVQYGMPTSNNQTAPNTIVALQAAAKGHPPGDIWEDVVKPMMLYLMTPSDGTGSGLLRGQMWVNTLNNLSSACKRPGDPGAADPEIGNKLAVNLLNTRFNNATQIIKGNLNFPYSDYAADMRTYMAMALATNFGTSYCLEKIFNAASIGMFKLVHNVESATLAPCNPVLNQKLIWRDINASEYTHIRGQGSMPRKVAGVGLISSNPYLPYTQNSTKGFIVGAFRRSIDGQFILARAPSWLHYRNPPSNIDFTNLRTVTQKGQPSPPVAARAVAVEQEMGCRIARQYYYEEVYRNRSADLYGRLRFDICPGSVVRVKTAGPPLPQFSGYLHANVAMTIIQIDCNDPKAQTILGLSHMRPEETTDWADETHPLYTDQAWQGSPLVKLYDNDLTPFK